LADWLYDSRHDVADPFDAEEPMKVHKNTYCLSGLPSSHTDLTCMVSGGSTISLVDEQMVADRTCMGFVSSNNLQVWMHACAHCWSDRLLFLMARARLGLSCPMYLLGFANSYCNAHIICIYGWKFILICGVIISFAWLSGFDLCCLDEDKEEF
jgi:hypothetical protein